MATRNINSFIQYLMTETMTSTATQGDSRDPSKDVSIELPMGDRPFYTPMHPLSPNAGKQVRDNKGRLATRYWNPWSPNRDRQDFVDIDYAKGDV